MTLGRDKGKSFYTEFSRILIPFFTAYTKTATAGFKKRPFGQMGIELQWSLPLPSTKIGQTTSCESKKSM